MVSDMKKTLLFLLILITSIPLFAQTQEEFMKANTFGKQAVTLIDEGKFDKAIELLDSAAKWNPSRVEYPYEKALAYFYKNEFSTAYEILDSLTKNNRINEMIYVLKSNCLTSMNKRDEAAKLLQEGLVKFKKSGKIYAELGLLQFEAKKDNLAISEWEKGVSVASDYPNNYYYLSKIFSMNYFFVWSLIDGEIYILLSENETKVKEISKIMYNVFNRSLFFKEEKSKVPQIKFTLKGIKTDKPKAAKDLPFEMAYESVMQKVAPFYIKDEKGNISIAKISKIREEFILEWYRQNLNEKFTNLLFDWNRKLIGRGYFEAYNYLLFKEGNIEEYNEWYKKNKDKSDEFMNWLIDNPVIFDETKNVQRMNLE